MRCWCTSPWGQLTLSDQRENFTEEFAWCYQSLLINETFRWIYEIIHSLDQRGPFKAQCDPNLQQMFFASVCIVVSLLWREQLQIAGSYFISIISFVAFHFHLTLLWMQTVTDAIPQLSDVEKRAIYFVYCREIMAAPLYARMVTSGLSWEWVSMAEAVLAPTSLASSSMCLSTHSGYTKSSNTTPALSRPRDSTEPGD